MDSIDTVDSMAQVQVKLKRFLKEEDDADDVVSEAILGVTNRPNDLLSNEDINGQVEARSPSEGPSQLEWVHDLLRPVQRSSLDNLGLLFVDCLYEYSCFPLSMQMSFQFMGNSPRQLSPSPVVHSPWCILGTGESFRGH